MIEKVQNCNINKFRNAYGLLRISKISRESRSAHAREFDSVSFAAVIVEWIVCSASATGSVELGAEWITGWILAAALVAKLGFIGNHAVLTAIKSTLSRV